MNRTTLRLAIATDKLRQATVYGNDSVGILYHYLRTKGRASDFEHTNAGAVCKDSVERLQNAGKVFLQAGGQKDSPEFEQAFKVRGKLGMIEHALFHDKDSAQINNAAESADVCAWGTIREATIKLAA